LPAMALCLALHQRLTHRYRRRAGSYRGLWISHTSCSRYLHGSGHSLQPPAV